MTRTLSIEELNLISGGATKLGLNNDHAQSKVWSGATKQTSDGGDETAPVNGNMFQNPDADRPDSIF